MSGSFRLQSGLAFMAPSAVLDTSRTYSQLFSRDDSARSPALNLAQHHSEGDVSFEPAFSGPSARSLDLGSVTGSQLPQTRLPQDHSIASNRNEQNLLRSLPGSTSTSAFGQATSNHLPTPIFALDPSLSQPSHPSSHDRDLENFLHVIAARFRFSPQIISILEEFASHSIQAQLTLLLGLMLDSREALDTPIPIANQTWSMTSQLRAAIRFHSRSFLLAPTLGAYRGKSMDRHVLSAMRDLNVPGLPPSNDRAHVSSVLKQIVSELSLFRATIKRTIRESLLPSKENAAELSTSLLRHISTTDELTLLHCVRFAFLRQCMSHEGDGSSYWVRVDEILSDMRSKAVNDTDFLSLFSKSYNDDVAKFGDPVKAGFRFIDLTEATDSLREICGRAQKVQKKAHKLTSEDKDGDGDLEHDHED